MIRIKKPFETVVEENAAWLYHYVRQRLRNPTLAEDLTQEIWIKAFRAYPAYAESGQLRGWLLRIAKNTISTYYSTAKTVSCLSLDADNEEADSFYTYLQAGKTPEDEYLEKERIEEVMSVIRCLPDRQREVLTRRYLHGMTNEQIAAAMSIPIGTVKSTAHYAIKNVQKQFGIVKQQKGAMDMLCQDVYKDLFKDALGVLADNRKEAMTAHLKSCDSCRRIWQALKAVIPQMTYALDDEAMHYLISFPEQKLAFCGSRYEIEEYEELNRLFDKTDRVIPDGEDHPFLSFGFNKCDLLGFFDNSGADYEYRLTENGTTHLMAHITRMPYVYPHLWQYNVFQNTGTERFITRSKEAPNLYYGHLGNSYGSQVKSALYQAIPAEAENIRIKRGNGVIDAGTYKFAYVDRYVAEDEGIVLDYSYLLNP